MYKARQLQTDLIARTVWWARPILSPPARRTSALLPGARRHRETPEAQGEESAPRPRFEGDNMSLGEEDGTLVGSPHIEQGPFQRAATACVQVASLDVGTAGMRNSMLPVQKKTR